MQNPEILRTLERPAWVRLECDWLRGGLRQLRRILSADSEWERHLRFVQMANQSVYLMRDHDLERRSEAYGGPEGGGVLLLLLGQRIAKSSSGMVTLKDLLETLELRLKNRGSTSITRTFLDALAQITPVSSIHDLATNVLHNSFPLPMDRFLDREFRSLGWSIEHVPFETVTQAQALKDDPRERGGPDNLMNFLGRLVGWADAFPSWNFTNDGWEAIRFNSIPEAHVLKDTCYLDELEGYPLPLGAGPAYAEVRRKLLSGEPFEIRLRGDAAPKTIESKIFPLRRVELHPEGFLRVSESLKPPEEA